MDKITLEFEAKLDYLRLATNLSKQICLIIKQKQDTGIINEDFIAI